MSAELVKRLRDGEVSQALFSATAARISELELELRVYIDAAEDHMVERLRQLDQLAAEKALADRRGMMLMQIEAIVPFESFGLGNTFSDEVEDDVTAYRKAWGV